MQNNDQGRFGVSVVIPCYNAGAFIDEAVNSVLAQKTSVPFKIIIVDDGSDDLNTQARISYYENLANASDLPLSVIRHSENKGLSATRNTAIKAAETPYILPLDADDRLVTPNNLKGRPSYISQGANILDMDGNIDVVSPQAYFFGNVNGSMRYPRMDERLLLHKCHIPAFSMIRKSAIEDVGGYNEDMRFAEDWDLWVAIANNRKLNGKVGGFERIDEHLVEYRTHANTSNLSASFKAVNTWPFEKMIARSPEIFDHHFPHVPRSVLPHYLLAHKLAYIGKLSIKSTWSENAATFMANKRGAAKALIADLVDFRDKPDDLQTPGNDRH